MESLTQSFNNTKLMKIPVQTTATITALLNSDSTVVEAKEATVKKAEMQDVRSQLLKTVVSAAQFEGFRLMRNSTPTPPELIVDKFEINYAAAETITLAGGGKSEFFRLHPFGYKRIDHTKRVGPHQGIPNNGELFIELGHIEAPN